MTSPKMKLKGKNRIGRYSWEIIAVCRGFAALRAALKGKIL